MVETDRVEQSNQRSNEVSRVSGDDQWLRQTESSNLTNGQTKNQGFRASASGYTEKAGPQQPGLQPQLAAVLEKRILICIAACDMIK